MRGEPRVRVPEQPSCVNQAHAGACQAGSSCVPRSVDRHPLAVSVHARAASRSCWAIQKTGSLAMHCVRATGRSAWSTTSSSTRSRTASSASAVCFTRSWTRAHTSEWTDRQVGPSGPLGLRMRRAVGVRRPRRKRGSRGARHGGVLIQRSCCCVAVVVVATLVLLGAGEPTAVSAGSTLPVTSTGIRLLR